MADLGPVMRRTLSESSRSSSAHQRAVPLVLAVAGVDQDEVAVGGDARDGVEGEEHLPLVASLLRCRRSATSREHRCRCWSLPRCPLNARVASHKDGLMAHDN